jgi:multidrug resistance efflux pump
MEAWNSYNIRGYNFMVWFFRLLLLFAVTVVVLLAVLKINETVPIREGQVIAANPQADYMAPAEAEVVRINVKVGQPVNKGDTLMILRNPDLVQQQEKTKTEIRFLQDKMASPQKDVSIFRGDYEKQLLMSYEVLKRIENDLAKMNVVATVTGIVHYVFNTEKSINFIDKGEILLSIVPQNDSYYAKVTIEEKDIPYIKAGMPVRLKMDAYQGMQYGMLNGRISYVSERKQEEKFFALVDLPKGNKLPLRSGYTIYGEIVLQQLPLYKYFMKKLFKNT